MDDWIRVTIGTCEENEIFVKALKEVINDLQS
jgi:histidinol-phosphate/aromatic aminotransferase/cobyric acid decarboxylase-like protein